jgi:hypothetical protein
MPIKIYAPPVQQEGTKVAVPVKLAAITRIAIKLLKDTVVQPTTASPA